MKICFTGNVFPFGEGCAYGGERILYYLIQGLHKRGHEVYLFAREGSNIPSQYIKSFVPVGALDGKVDVHYEAVKKYLENNPVDFDIYQCNYFGDGWNPEILDRFNYCELTWCVWSHIHWQLKQPTFNTISYSKVMQQDFSNLNVNTTMIHYGLPENLYQFSPEHDDYAVWIGKIESGKAPQLAIQLAKAAGLKIVLMGPPYNSGHFWNLVYPYIDNKNVFWVRGVDDQMKQKIMSRAKVFISSNDNTWKEHFGIVNAESLAMGTPIIAFNRINQDCAIKVDGIIEDGKHGFFLNYKDSNDVEEIIEKGVPLLNKIGEINRADCRMQFVNNFTSDLMAEKYELFYNQILENKRIFACQQL